MPDPLREIEPQVLSAEAWAPFGWLPVPDTDPDDGRQQLAFEWSDPHVNLIGHRRQEVVSVPGGLRCDVLYRHRTHTQVLMPLDHRAVLAVAPPGAELAGPEGSSVIAAFVLEPLQALVLHRGTWHWGPFPVRDEAVQLFNVQGRRYLEDNESVDLAALGRSVVVRTGAAAGR